MDKNSKTRAGVTGMAFAGPRRLFTVGTIVLLLGGLAWFLSSQQQGAEERSLISISPPAKAPVAAGVSAGKQPATPLDQHGPATSLPRLDPVVEAEVRRLSKSSMAGAEIVHHKNGTVQANFKDGQYQQVLAAAIDENGELVIAHGEDFLAPDSSHIQEEPEPEARQASTGY